MLREEEEEEEEVHHRDTESPEREEDRVSGSWIRTTSSSALSVPLW
jgi:hypothetical protein